MHGSHDCGTVLMVNHAVCKDIEIGKIKFKMSYGVVKLLIGTKHIHN